MRMVKEEPSAETLREMRLVSKMNSLFIKEHLKPGTLFTIKIAGTLYDYDKLNKLFEELELSLDDNSKTLTIFNALLSHEHELNAKSVFYGPVVEEIDSCDFGEIELAKDKIKWLLLLDNKHITNWHDMYPETLPSHSEHISGIRFFTVLDYDCRKSYLVFTTYSNRNISDEIMLQEEVTKQMKSKSKK